MSVPVAQRRADRAGVGRGCIADWHRTDTMCVSAPSSQVKGLAVSFPPPPLSCLTLCELSHQATIDAIRLLSVIVLSIGLASFALGMVDRILERGPELARLRLLGTPVGTLRAAHWVEMALPLLVGCTLALGVGHLGTTTYLTLANAGLGEPEYHLAPAYLLGPVLGALIGSVLVAATTSLGLGGRLRPDQLRQA